MHYNLLLPGRPPENGGKVEILELSMYTTYSAYPQATEFRDALKDWVKAHQSVVTYTRQPSIAAGMEHAKLQARIFFSFEDLGRDDLQEKFDVWVKDPAREHIYHSIWDPDAAAVYELTRQFAKENGIDEVAFDKAYHSPDMESRIIHMISVSAWAKMDGSPTFVIDHRFSVSAQRLAYPRTKLEPVDYERLLQVIDYLVASQVEFRGLAEHAKTLSSN